MLWFPEKPQKPKKTIHPYTITAPPNMGQCRSSLSALLPSPNHHKANRKGTAAFDDSYSEFGGGRGLLSDGSVNESFRSNPPGTSKSQKKQFDYYGGTIGGDDLIIEEDNDETKASQ